MTRRLIALLAAALLLCGCGTEPPARSKVTARPTATAAPKRSAFSGADIRWKETPGSSCFAWVGYAGDYEKLAVIFRTSPDRVYIYNDFTQADYRAFMDADSLGGYYNENIKGQYPSKRIDDIYGTEYDPEG